MQGLDCYEKMEGHFIWDYMKDEAMEASAGFAKIYDEEISVAASMEEKLWRIICSDKKEKYPARFKLNFDGVQV